MDTTFTFHGAKRVCKRIGLQPASVSKILDNDLWVSVGVEEGTNREHCLFLSPYDRECFVAIRDAETKQVITILPLDYHENLAWPVTEGQVLKAKSLRRKIIRLLERKVANTSEIPDMTPKIRGSAICFGKDGTRKIVGIGSLPKEIFGTDVGKAAKSERLRDYFDMRLSEQGYGIADVYSVLLKSGKKGEGILILAGELE